MLTGNRLKEIRDKKNLTISQLSEILNISDRTLGSYEREERKPSAELIEALLTHLKLNPNWLFNGQGRMFLDEEKQEIDITEIPERGEVETSAGSGCFVNNEEITGYISFEKSLLRQLGASIPDCDVLRVKGDSMEPTLTTGDKILVDKSKKDVLEGRIYILRVENTLYVKRLQKLPRGRLEVISDNKEYKAFELIPNEDDFEVCGRVLWSGRVFI